MRISMIVAMSENRCIGKEGKLPWKIPSEYVHYRKLTEGHHVILGRQNYELNPGEFNTRPALVITRDPELKLDVPCFTEIEAAIEYAQNQGESEVFILGGAPIYRLALPLVDRLYLSVIKGDYAGDRYFPPHEQFSWNEVASEDHTEWSYKVLEKC